MKFVIATLAFALGLAVAVQEDPKCICNRMYFPICGSDGATYNNFCLLKCNQKTNPELTAVSYGRCEDQKLVAEPVCMCNKMYLPVCGSDGVTYSNPCLLRCQQKNNPGLTMEKYGACVNKVEVSPTYAPVCPLIWAPVCGSDGKTYGNMCQFKYAQTQINGLTLVHQGACSEVQEAKEVKCPAVCPAIWAPVCGSDGNTYASMCNFNCKQTQVDGLTLLHQGVCGKIQANEMPVCACPYNYAPVCGTDGKTYGNMCGLKCQQKANSELQVAYEGECQKMPVCACPLIYAPVCGSDSKTYSNMCALNCMKKVNSGLSAVYHGICHHEAVCACTREYNPICGSDGKTYGNPCTFRCQQKSDNGLTMAHYGEC